MESRTRLLLLLFLLAIIVGLCAAYVMNRYRMAPSDTAEQTAPLSETPMPRGAPSFVWEYEVYERDSMLRTALRLRAAYQDGTTERKEIDDIEGTCTEHPEPDADVYEDSTMIICYYAGLGRYYKVVATSDYAVLRQVFEEASPDYDPPQLPFETVAQF